MYFAFHNYSNTWIRRTNQPTYKNRYQTSNKLNLDACCNSSS